MQPDATRPIDTYLRRPRVVILEDGPLASVISQALARAPVAVRRAATIEDAERVLRRSFVTIIACTAASAHRLVRVPKRFRSNPAPAFLVTPSCAQEDAAYLGVRPYRHCTVPIDPRRVVADVLALAHGWHSADTRLVELDARLSFAPDCGLLFCDGQLVSLLRMERLVFAMLAREPGRLVPWQDLADATGASQKLLYVSADRLRRKLEEFIPGHGYIATRPGRGLALDLIWTAQFT